MEEEDAPGPSCGKRVRNPNFSLDEKSYLLQLVAKYKNILENKKTDATTNADKERTWQKIALQFNAVAPNNIRREAISLKKAYLNIKRKVRKDVGDEKIEMIKTGGGPAKKSQNVLQEMALLTMNKKSVFGLQNKFDGDNLELENVLEGGMNENEAVSENDVGLDENQQNVSDISTEEHQLEINDDTHHYSSKWKAPNLNKPLDPLLRQKMNKVLPSTSTRQAEGETLKSRRRPTATAVALHSSEIGKLYTKLVEEKLEIANIEKSILQKRLVFETIKQELEIEILKAELKNKKN